MSESTFATNVTVSELASPRSTSPLATRVVKVPAAGVAPPITAPSIVPPLISAVVTVPKSEIVDPAKLYVPASKVPAPTFSAAT